MNNLLIWLRRSNGKWDRISMDDLLTLIAQNQLQISSDNGTSAVQARTDEETKQEQPTNDSGHSCLSCKHFDMGNYYTYSHFCDECVNRDLWELNSKE